VAKTGTDGSGHFLMPWRTILDLAL